MGFVIKLLFALELLVLTFSRFASPTGILHVLTYAQFALTTL